MKLNPSVLMILILPFLFAEHECRVFSERHSDETLDETEKQLHPKISLDKQNYFEGDIIIPKRPTGGIKPSAVYEYDIWPNKKIPYVISKNFTKDQTNLILDAMKAFQSKTCIQFIPRTTEKDYINIFSGDGCYSYVGKWGGIQPLSLGNGCLYSDTIKHELMHAVGFYHEQSRTDRDDYVTIVYSNIQTGMENNFEKYDSQTVQLLGTPYDIKSIMHYGWNYFAKDRSKPTIISKAGAKIEPSNDFTLTDILDLNRLYKCPNDSYIEWKEQAWNNARFFWGSGCDIVGSNIRKVKSKREDCGGICSADLKCTHFTWESSGICTLKTAPKLSTETRPLKGAICGYIAAGNSNFQWIDSNMGKEKYTFNCDFPGNDIRNVPITKTTCFSLCISEPKCTSYIVRLLPGSINNFACYLKSGKRPIAISKVDKNAYCSMIIARI